MVCPQFQSRSDGKRPTLEWCVHSFKVDLVVKVLYIGMVCPQFQSRSDGKSPTLEWCVHSFKVDLMVKGLHWNGVSTVTK